MLKSVLVAILSSWPVRSTVKALDAAGMAIVRCWGQLRFRAKLPNAGLNSTCHWAAVLKYPQNITVGDHVNIGDNVVIGAHSPVIIEDLVRISRGVIIETAGGDFDKPPPYQHISKPIVIKKGAWLGTNAVVLGGVTIGEYAIVAGGTIVTKDVPPGSFLAPATNRCLPIRKSWLRVRLSGPATPTGPATSAPPERVSTTETV